MLKAKAEAQDDLRTTSGQEGLLIAAAMPPRETQGMEHGGTPHQGGGKGKLPIAAQSIAVSKIGSASIAKAGPFAVGAAIPGHTGPPTKAIKVSPPRDIVPGDAVLCDAEFPLPSGAKPSNRKWGDVAVARRPVTTGPTDDPFVREPQPPTTCGIGKDNEIVKVTRVDERWYMVTYQGGQQRRLSDEQLSLLPTGESLMTMENDKSANVKKELVNVIDDEGSELSIPEIDINDTQIAAARQAIERSKIQAELADDAETMLQSYLNPAPTDQTNPRPPGQREREIKQRHRRSPVAIRCQATIRCRKAIRVQGPSEVRRPSDVERPSDASGPPEVQGPLEVRRPSDVVEVSRSPEVEESPAASYRIDAALPGCQENRTGTTRGNYPCTKDRRQIKRSWQCYG
jgi:hypothetical protein